MVDAVFPPDQIKGTSVTMHLEVENCDAAVKRAADGGATVTMAPWDSFWGARYARIMDPFGHSWSFAHPAGKGVIGITPQVLCTSRLLPDGQITSCFPKWPVQPLLQKYF